jgi:NhaA family Na+:H+ antiporter
VAYAILPLFAFATAGLSLDGVRMRDLASGLPLGIAIALVTGKPVGIVGAALGLRAAGLAALPEGMDTRALIGLGLLCGIGFTMSLFVASLAYDGGARYDAAVLGVLSASLVSALLGYGWLRMAWRSR